MELPAQGGEGVPASPPPLWIFLAPTWQGLSVPSHIQFAGCPHWNDPAFIASPSFELLQRSRQILSSSQKLVFFLSRRPSFHSSFNQTLPQFLGDGSICLTECGLPELSVWQLPELSV